jgi:hypothetical protein
MQGVQCGPATQAIDNAADRHKVAGSNVQVISEQALSKLAVAHVTHIGPADDFALLVVQQAQAVVQGVGLLAGLGSSMGWVNHLPQCRI